MTHQSAGEAQPRAVASTKHTAVLCLILCAIAAAGLVSERQATSEVASSASSADIWTYAALIGAELALLAFIRIGARDTGGRLLGLVSIRGFAASSLLTDVIGGICLFALWTLADGLLTRWIGGGDQAVIRNLVVHRAALIPVWVALSFVAGFTEEITFRGYLLRQFGNLTDSAWLGVVLQALLFGVILGYQEPLFIVRIAVPGLGSGEASCRTSSLTAWTLWAG